MLTKDKKIGGKTMLSKKILLCSFAFMLAATASSAFADVYNETTAPNVTAIGFTPNYTISSSAYMQDAVTIRINATIGNVVNSSAPFSNVSAKVNNATHLVTIVNLTNTSANINASQTWTGTFTSPAYDITSGNITINASYKNSTGAYLQNATIYKAFKLDATNPSATFVTADNYVIKQRTGYSMALQATATDTVAVKNCSIDFTSVPTGSAIVDATATSASGTSMACSYTFTPDVLGEYKYRFTVYDNVTNTYTTYNQTVTFRLRDDGVVPTSGQSTNPSLPPVSMTSNPITGFFGWLWNLMFGWI